MKLSHEIPLCLLEESRRFNDYDYALVHLFETHPLYYQFYKDSIELGRHVLLDNSIFELGKAFDSKKFAYWINELKPTEYIIPDSLENANETVSNLQDWMAVYNNLPGKKIGVVQGKTYEELVYCYQVLEQHVDKIAISFDWSFYLDLFKDNNDMTKWEKLMWGRRIFIDRLVDDKIIKYDKPIHLLGCGLPQEFEYYKQPKYSFVETIDTSNPIVHAIRAVKYETYGLKNKETIKLVDLLEYDYDKINRDILKHNINKFRNFVNK